jgi:hypothetical protein
MMRIAELLENITASGSLSPAEYAPIAQQAQAQRQQQAQAVRTQQLQAQQARQQQVWSRGRAVKPKPIKFKVAGRRKTRRRAPSVRLH